MTPEEKAREIVARWQEKAKEQHGGHAPWLSTIDEILLEDCLAQALAQPTDEEIAKAAESSEWGSKYTTELAFTHGAYWALAKMKGDEK